MSGEQRFLNLTRSQIGSQIKQDIGGATK